MTRPKANEMPSRSAPVTAGVLLPARTSVATTLPGPTRTSSAVPSVSATTRWGRECSIAPPEWEGARPFVSSDLRSALSNAVSGGNVLPRAAGVKSRCAFRPGPSARGGCGARQPAAGTAPRRHRPASYDEVHPAAHGDGGALGRDDDLVEAVGGAGDVGPRGVLGQPHQHEPAQRPRERAQALLGHAAGEHVVDQRVEHGRL